MSLQNISTLLCAEEESIYCCLHYKFVESEELGDVPGAEEVADVNCAEVVIKFLE